jgi:hypothetical protein
METMKTHEIYRKLLKHCLQIFETKAIEKTETERSEKQLKTIRKIVKNYWETLENTKSNEKCR